MKITAGHLTIDFSRMFYEKLAEYGVTSQEWQETRPILIRARERFIKEKHNLGFYTVLFDDSLIKNIEKFIDKTDDSINTIVVVGIGGSDLGTRAVHEALHHSFFNQIRSRHSKKIYFTGDTTDPTPIMDLFDILTFEHTLFLIISKSGETIETTVSYLLILEELKKQRLKAKKHIAVVTDPEQGDLHDLAEENDYRMFPIPPEVGGRFSVLSSCGLLPLGFTGIDIEKLQKAGREMAELYKTAKFEEDAALAYAGLHYLFMKKGFNMAVFMPYIYAFKHLGRWLRQLWAESLGKEKHLKGTINEIMTLINAMGPTDQHSQLQLYNSGPDDKVFTFVTTKTHPRDVEIAAEGDFSHLNGQKMGEILKKELAATRHVLTENNKPNCTIILDSINEESVAELIYFLELSVVYLGYMMEINQFDQPGVESSKNIIRGLVGERGYEHYAIDIEEKDE